MTVKFNNSLTQAQYDALGSKDAGTLYFTTDTKRIYKGTIIYSSNSDVLDVTYNSTTKLLTITYLNGTTSQLDLATELAAKLDKKPDGVNNLFDGNNKLSSAYLPDSIAGQLSYCGTYNASTGALANDLREPALRAWKKGDYLINLAAGNKLPDNSTHSGIAVGDWALFDGTGWDIIPNTDAVASVNSKTGTVVLDKSDVGLGNVDNVKQASKAEFDAHNGDDEAHVTQSERLAWNAKTNVVVESGLSSTDTTKALSAAQGKVLNDRLMDVENAITWG